MCSAPVRPHFKKLIDRFIPDLIVLAYEEVLSTIEIRSLGTLELADAD
jgi:flagellar biosynthesis protein FlhA